MSIKDNAAKVAEDILNGQRRIETRRGPKRFDGITSMILGTHPLELLERAESFIAGFEDDPDQEGVPQLLEDLRSAIAELQ